MIIHEAPHEIAVVAEYKDGGKFCLAKFMYEEDARAWLEQREAKEWVTYRLYKRTQDAWEPLYREE